MAKQYLEETKDITDFEWKQLEESLKTSSLLSAAKMLKDNNNRPMRADVLFHGINVGQGNSVMNQMLRLKKVPFSLMRIGKHNDGKKRPERLFAFVRVERK